MGKCEKRRVFSIDLRKNVLISAVFRSFSPRFHSLNREVVFPGGEARSVPVLARTEGMGWKNHLVSVKKAQGPRVASRSRFT